MNTIKTKLFFFLLSIFCLNPLYAGRVNRIKLEKVNGCVKVLILTNALQYKDTLIHNPERIVIDFQKAHSRLPKEIISSYSPLIKIRTSQYSLNPYVTRVVLDLKHKTIYSISRSKRGIEINLGKKSGKKLGKKGQLHQGKTKVKPKKKSIKKAVKKSVKKAKVELSKELPVLPSKSEVFFYNSRGKRDPFSPYLGIQVKDTLLGIGNATIVGIMWSPNERYALAQDAQGKAYILQEGDRVSGGKVLYIRKKKVVFLMRVFGGTKKISLQVTPKKEEK